MINDQKQSQKAAKLSGVLGKILHSLGLTERYNGWTAVNRWSEIVGEEMAKRAKAVKFEDGCLYVAVESDVWRQQISMQLDEIKKKIHQYPFGRAIKTIRLIRTGKG